MAEWKESDKELRKEDRIKDADLAASGYYIQASRELSEFAPRQEMSDREKRIFDLARREGYGRGIQAGLWFVKNPDNPLTNIGQLIDEMYKRLDERLKQEDIEKTKRLEKTNFEEEE